MTSRRKAAEASDSQQLELLIQEFHAAEECWLQQSALATGHSFLAYVVEISEDHPEANRLCFISRDLQNRLDLEPNTPIEPYFWLSVFHPADRDSYLSSTRKVLDKKVSITRQFRLRPLNTDTTSTYLETAVPHTDSSGKVFAISSVVQEIPTSTLRRSELETYVQESVNHLPVILFALDQAGKFTLSVGKGLEKLGLKPGQVVGLSAYDLYESIPEVAGYIDRALAGETISATVSDGRITVDFTYVPHRDESGEVIGVFGLAIDATQRQHAEKAYRKEAEQNRLIFEHTLEGFIQIDLSTGKLRDVNPSFASMLGYECEELAGKRLADIEGQETTEGILQHIEVITAQGSDRFTSKMYHKDGHVIHLEVVANLVEAPEGPILFSFIRDISDQVRVNQLQDEMAQQLVEEVTTRTKQLDLLSNRFRRQRDYLQSIIDTAQVIILVLDKDGKIVLFNTFMEQLAGYTLKEVHGKDWFKTFLPEEDHAGIRSLFQVALDGTPTRGNMNPIIDRDGQMIEIEWYSTTLHDVNDETHGLLAIGTDVSDRIELQNALEESNRRFELIAEAIEEVFWIGTPDWRVLEYISPAYEKIWNRSREALYENPNRWLDSIMPEDRQTLLKSVSEPLTKTNRPGHIEYRINRPNGTIRWIEVRAYPVIGEDGQVVKVAGIARDITELHQTREELRQSEAHYAGFFHNNLAPMLVTSLPEGLIIEANQAFCELVGHEKDHIIGKTTTQVNLVVHRREREKIVRDLEQSADHSRIETQIRTRYGEIRDVLGSATKLAEGASTLALTTLMDVTEWKLAERNLREHQMNLERLVAERTADLEQANKELKDREAQLEAQYQHLPLPTYTFQKTGDEWLLIDYNQASHVLSQGGAQQFLGQRLGEIDATPPGVLQDFATCWAEKRVIQKEMEFTFVTTGQTRFVHAYYVPIHPDTILVHIDDITERVKVRENLRKSEARLVEAQEIAHLGNWEWNIENNDLWWSDEIYRIFGREPNAFGATYDAFLETVHPDDRALVERSVNEALNEQKPYSIDHRIVLPDKSIRFVHEQARVDFTPDGKPVRMMGTVQDITEQIKAQRKLVESESRLAEAQRIARLGNWERDLETGEEWWSDELCQIYGLESEDVPATQEELLSYIHPDDLPAFQASLDRLGKVGEVEQEFRIIRKDGGERIIYGHARVDYDRFNRPIRLYGTNQDITHTKKLESNLHLLSTAVEQSTNLVMITDVGGNIEYVNPTFERVTGFSSKEVIGKTPRLLKSGLAPAEKYRELWGTILAGKQWQGEFPNRRKDGEIFWARETISPLRDEHGQITHFIAIEEDITSQKKTEEALQESESRYLHLFDNIPVGVYRSSPDGRILDANMTLVHMLGYQSREQLLDVDANALYHHNMAREEWFDNIKRNASIYDTIMQLKRADGSLIWVQDKGFIARDKEGNIIGLEGFVIDISDRKRAEDALLESERMFRALAELSPAAIFLASTKSTSTHADVIYANSASESISGFSRSELPWGGSLQLITPPHQERVTEHFIDIVSNRSEQIIEDEIKILTKSGDQRWIDLRMRLVQVNRQDAILGLGLDITSRKEMEAVEREQRQFAEALSRASAAVNSSLEVDEVLDAILDIVESVVPHDAASIMMIDGDQIRVARSRGFDADDEMIIQELSFSLQDTQNLKEMVDQHRAIAIPDTRDFSGWVTVPGLTMKDLSFVGAPIRKHDAVVGFLNLISTKPDTFSDRHAAQLQSFADQVSLAITNAQLYEAERERRLTAQTLQKTAESLANSIRLEDTLSSILNEVREIIPYHRATVSLTEGQFLTELSVQGYGEHERMLGSAIPISEVPLFDQVLTKAQLQVVEDVGNDPRWPVSSHREEKIALWVGVPLIASEVMLGVLGMAFQEHVQLTDSQLATIQTFAQQAAVAIRNARIVDHLESSLAELRRAQEQLRRSARLSALGEVAAGVAHQINNPLAAVIGRSHRLLSKVDPSSDIYGSLAVIKQAAYRAGAIVERMLNLARDQDFAVRPINVNESITGTIPLIDSQMRQHNINIKLSLEESLPLVLADDERLQDVWLNLLINALDVLKAETETSSKRISIQTYLDDDLRTIVINFSNNGSTISEEDQEKIFTPFFTTKTHGTGLGLAICHDIITKHKGSIVLDTSADNTTQFVIKLPVAENGEASQVLS